jgi:hypothetical protein
MKLARVVPGANGSELRSFECDKCVQVLTLRIETDPMNSDKFGWLSGELRPPK